MQPGGGLLGGWEMGLLRFRKGSVKKEGVIESTGIT